MLAASNTKHKAAPLLLVATIINNPSHLGVQIKSSRQLTLAASGLNRVSGCGPSPAVLCKRTLAIGRALVKGTSLGCCRCATHTLQQCSSEYAKAINNGRFWRLWPCYSFALLLPILLVALQQLPGPSHLWCWDL